MMRFNNIKIVSLAMAASLPVLYLGFSADASSTFAKYVGRCANNLEFYERHTRWCEAAYTVAPRMARHARAAGQETVSQPRPYGDQVTVYRDRQANTEVGEPDRFIALQTTADVQRNSF